MNNYIRKLDNGAVAELILKARRLLILSLPGIHTEVSKELLQASKICHEVRVITDASEQSIRNGFGEYSSLPEMKKAGIKLFDYPGNMVSFIISDKEGYFLFPQSRIFEEGPSGCNAVMMDPYTRARVIGYFFPPMSPDENQAFVGLAEEAELEIRRNLPSIYEIGDIPPADMLRDEKIREVGKAIKNNPPLHPDLQRNLKAYQAKIQFVEMEFVGANLSSTKVRLPRQAIPFKDEQLTTRLEAKIKLFDNIKGTAGYKPLLEIGREVDALRKSFLVAIGSRDKSVIKKERKTSFQESVEILRNKLKSARTKVDSFLAGEIMNSKESVRKEVVAFLTENPQRLDPAYRKQEDLFKRKVEDIASDIAGKMSFPEPANLLSRLGLNVNYYDLTWDDFHNEDLLKQLVEKEVMDKGDVEQIVELRDVFEAREGHSAPSGRVSH